MTLKKWIGALAVSCLISFGVGVHVGQQNAGQGSTPFVAVAMPPPVARVVESEPKVSRQAQKIYEILEGKSEQEQVRGKHTMPNLNIPVCGYIGTVGDWTQTADVGGHAAWARGATLTIVWDTFDDLGYVMLDGATALYRSDNAATVPYGVTWSVVGANPAPAPTVNLADTAKPTTTAAAVSENGMNVAVTHSETVTGTTGYIVKVNGVTRSQASASTLAGVTTIVMNQAIENANAVTLDYTPGNVADGAGNTMDAFTAQAVTNSSRFRQWGAGRCVGLSTTTKPAAANGSEFFEEDGLKAIYKRIAGAWVLQSIPISGIPTAGQVPTATSGTAAAWATPAAGGGGGASLNAQTALFAQVFS